MTRDTTELQKWLDLNRDIYGQLVVSPLDAATAPVINLKPTPITPPINHIIQAADVFAFQQDHGDKTILDTVITQGGLIHSTGGGKLTIRRCWSEGAPKGIGVYFALIATGAGRELIWDNTSCVDRWIVNGDEAALRIMGDCKSAMIVNVDFCNRLHDLSDHGDGIMDPSKTKLSPIPKLNPLTQPTPPAGAKYDWWKQVVQIRDVRHCEFHGGRIVGLLDVGQQANPTTNQTVDYLLLDGVGMTNDPHFTKSYKKVVRKNCYRISNEGVALKNPDGTTRMWPDQEWGPK